MRVFFIIFTAAASSLLKMNSICFSVVGSSFLSDQASKLVLGCGVFHFLSIWLYLWRKASNLESKAHLYKTKFTWVLKHNWKCQDFYISLPEGNFMWVRRRTVLQFISVPEPLRRTSTANAEFQGLVCVYQNKGIKMEIFSSNFNGTFCSLILSGKLSKPKLSSKNFKNVTYL